ncbi:hypothetical protein PR048_003008 [Dryococelus australis]|uniref:Uncharacterized protein n=1 Tax=Dryococelus australis TaxID=614101 RepID=A0ABQ9ILZ3_9NEOP|nr:hypothetical protein PR048_003008 [Dryococelus australis]
MSAAENAKSDGHQQHSKKFLYLFRFRHRKKSSSAGSISSPEERRRKLDHDMRTNWDELPATLRRRKEKLSQAVLDEFHSDDAVVYGEMTGDGGGTRVVVRADVNAEDAGEVSSIALSEDSLERGHRRNGSLKKLSEVLGPVEGQELSLGELKKLKEGLQEVLQTGIEPKQPEESRDNFEKEERHVIRLLSRAVSEDSLLIVSSGDEEQSSESEDDADDGGRSRQDSGTDVNTPSNCSSCGEEISSVVYEESRISSDDTSVDKRSTDDSSVGNSSGVDVHYSTPSVQNKKCEGNTGLSKHAASEEKSVENEETVKVSVDRQIADSYENSSVDPLYEKVLVTDKADTSPETAGKKTGEVGAVGRPTEDDSGWETCRVSPAGSESCWGGSQSSESEFGPTYVSFGSPGRELYDRVHIPRVGAPWGRQARRPLDEAAAPPPRLMTTIAEEEVEEDPPCAHLSVRQILKKFEELGGRMCPAEGDPEEKSATLREIHETLRCLEEKVRHYESTVQVHSPSHHILNHRTRIHGDSSYRESYSHITIAV